LVLHKIQTAQYLKSNVMFTLRQAELPLSQIISLALDGAGPMFKVPFSIVAPFTTPRNSASLASPFAVFWMLRCVMAHLS
jgi:hypothetical protein